MSAGYMGMGRTGASRRRARVPVTTSPNGCGLTSVIRTGTPEGRSPSILLMRGLGRRAVRLQESTMRGAGWIVAGVGVVISLAGGSVWAQEAAPQTARQALIEMFTSQAPGALEKHLPEAPLAALGKAQGGALPMSEFAGFAHDLSRGGKKLETFDTG